VWIDRDGADGFPADHDERPDVVVRSLNELPSALARLGEGAE